MIQNTLQSAFKENYPMILIFTVVIVSSRIIYLITHKEKFVLYRELGALAFLIYSLVLFYVVTFQDVNYGTNNYIPFHEITRYEFGSSYFIHNIVGNIILFIPFGYFITYIMKTRNPLPSLIITFITSIVIEYTQLMIGRTFDVDDIILNIFGSSIGYLGYLVIGLLEDRLPPFFSSTLFKNIFIIVLIIVVCFIYSKYTLWGILR